MAPGAVGHGDNPCRVRRGARLNWCRGNAGGCPFDASHLARRRLLRSQPWLSLFAGDGGCFLRNPALLACVENASDQGPPIRLNAPVSAEALQNLRSDGMNR
jgi:hypothetical protein